MLRCAQVRQTRLKELAVPCKLHVSTNTRAVSKLRRCILLRDFVTLWRDDNRLRAVSRLREKRRWEDTKAIFVEFCRSRHKQHGALFNSCHGFCARFLSNDHCILWMRPMIYRVQNSVKMMLILRKPKENPSCSSKLLMVNKGIVLILKKCWNRFIHRNSMHFIERR